MTAAKEQKKQRRNSNGTLKLIFPQLHKDLEIMPTVGQRSQHRAGIFEEMLQIYEEGLPGTIELVVQNFLFRYHEEGEDVKDLETLLCDLLADLRHFVRLRHSVEQASAQYLDLESIPELKDFIKDLREFAEKRAESWNDVLDASLRHLEREVEEEILDQVET